MAGQTASVTVYFLIKKKKKKELTQYLTQHRLASKLYSQDEHLILLPTPQVPGLQACVYHAWLQEVY